MAQAQDTKETSHSHFDFLHYVYCFFLFVCFLKLHFDRKLPFVCFWRAEMCRYFSDIIAGVQFHKRTMMHPPKIRPHVVLARYKLKWSL